MTFEHTRIAEYFPPLPGTGIRAEDELKRWLKQQGLFTEKSELGTWQNWSPVHTNLTVGDGTVVARYTQIGKLVVARWSLIWGTTTTINTAGGVSMSISAPVNGHPSYDTGFPFWHSVGTVLHQDDDSVNRHSSVMLSVNAGGGVNVSTLYPRSENYVSSNQYDIPPSNTQPFTWVAGDTMSLTATYEAE